MKKISLSLCVALLSTGLLSSCQSTTQGSVTGNDRSQLLLISSAEMNQAGNTQFKKMVAQAKETGAYNVPAAYANRVRTIFNRLVPQTTALRKDGTQINWEIAVFNSKDVNAFALPGGKMVVLSGIIKELNLSDDELAAIIGHEMGHVLREHSREQASQEFAKKQGFAIIAKAAKLNSSKTDMMNTLGKYALTLPFSRQMESESDTIGLELMARAGYNPEAAVTLWTKMEQLSSSGVLDALTSTHPTNKARITAIEKQLPNVMPLYEAAHKPKAPKAKGKGKKRK